MKQEHLLEYEEFVEVVAVEVEQRLQQKVQLLEVVKNNDITLQALGFEKAEINITPVMYLNPCYEMYCTVGLERVVEHIIGMYQLHQPKKNFDINLLFDRNEFCSRLRIRLVHYEKNKEQLEEVPYIQFLDLAITFCLCFDMQEREVGTVYITKKHMEQMNMSVEELYAIALENMESNYQFTSLHTLMELNVRMDVDDMEKEMYVLTTPGGVYGASLMLHKGILKKIMEEKKMKRMVILPSSIHEIIIMSYDSDMDIMGLNEMVQEVNRTALDATEVLSNHAYLFDGDAYTVCS